MSTHPLPGDLVISPDEAAALTAEAAGWKVLTLSPEDAGRVDMVMVGALPNLIELPAPSAFAASGDSAGAQGHRGRAAGGDGRDPRRRGRGTGGGRRGAAPDPARPP